MNQMLLTLIFMLTAATVGRLTVDSWPMGPPARQSNDISRPGDQRTDAREPVTDVQAAIIANRNLLRENPIQLNQVPSREIAASSRSSSQTFDKVPPLHPGDPPRGSALHYPLTATRVDSPSPSNPRDFSYGQNYSGTHNDNIDTDRLSEGSGAGAPQSAGKNHRPKFDDTEDSGVDDSDDDEDYDYRETLDSGSGHSQITSITRRPFQVPARNATVEKVQPSDFYNPFRPPTTATDQNLRQVTNGQIQPEMTTRQVMSTQPPNRVDVSAIPNIFNSSTTNAPQVSTTTTRDLVASVNRNNGTRADVDYDYEDDNDDDEEESSVFEDNDSFEIVPANNPAMKQQPNSTINTQTNNSSDIYNPTKTDITKQTVFYSPKPIKQPTWHPSMMTELPTTTAQHYTTARPVVQQMTTKAGIPISTTFSQSGNAGVHPGEGEEDMEEEEEGEDDEEEEEEDVIEEDDREEEPLVEPHKLNHSSIAEINQYNSPTQVPKPPASAITASTKLPSNQDFNMQTSPSIVSPSQSRHMPLDHQPAVTSPVLVRTTITPNQIISVPIIVTTTTTTPTSAKMAPTNNIFPNNRLIVEGNTQSPVFIQPTRMPSPNPTLESTTVLSTEGPKYMITSPPNTPSNESPATPVTTNILQFDRTLHDNYDTLTKQIYDKAVGVYREADKTIRAAWQAVWLSNMNFDSSAVEPLLNQPLFFMLALGATVIGLVLLMMLVVYIITYQIQPKDDDSSIY